MNVTRNGKIARLPKAVRDELNRRMADGEPGKRLVAWLNGLPEVQAVVIAEFGGKAIREQNLSEWRQGGYGDWLAQQAALEQGRQLATEVAELQQASKGPLTDLLAGWLAAHYAVAARASVRQAAGAAVDLKTLRALCADVITLRRGDHHAERLQLERERLDLDRQQTKEHLEKLCLEWARNPENEHKFRKPWLTPRERAEAIAQIYGRPLSALEADDPEEDADPAACI